MSKYYSQMGVSNYYGWAFVLCVCVCVTGNRCVSINAASMALIDAGIPLKDFVCASSAGYIEDTPLLGICRIRPYAHFRTQQ